MPYAFARATVKLEISLSRGYNRKQLFRMRLEGMGGGNIVASAEFPWSRIMSHERGARVHLEAKPMQIDSKPNSVYELGTRSNINKPYVETRYTGISD